MNQLNRKVQSINEKYDGKCIWDCEILGKMINFDYTELTFCCSCTSSVMYQNPKICDIKTVISGEFDKKVFFLSWLNTIEKNQTIDGPCVGCKFLTKRLFSPIDLEKCHISHLVYNNYRGCNSKCIYCFQDVSKVDEPYIAYKIVDGLLDENLLGNSIHIDFGGGEPTLLPNLGDYIEHAKNNNWSMLINSSGLIFSESIINGLKSGNVKLQISPDAGTFDTYKRIKRQSGFDIVWNNIKKYCIWSENVYIKYIVFSWNSSREEIEAFIDLCVKNGVKNVVISGESEAAWGIENRIYWEYGNKEIEASVYLMKLCMKNGIAFRLSVGNMSKEHEKEIVRRFVNNVLVEFINKKNVYIYGMGKNGKKICDYLEENQVKICGFIDSNLEKQKDSYKTYSCIDIDVINPENDVIIISPTNYKEIDILLENKKIKNRYMLYFE